MRFFSFLSFFLGKPLVNKTVILSLLHDKYVAKKSPNLKMSRPFRCTRTLAIEIIHAKLIIIVSYFHDRILCLCKEVNWNTPQQISLIFHQIWSSKSIFPDCVWNNLCNISCHKCVIVPIAKKHKAASGEVFGLQQSDSGNAFILSRQGLNKKK